MMYQGVVHSGPARRQWARCHWAVAALVLIPALVAMLDPGFAERLPGHAHFSGLQPTPPHTHDVATSTAVTPEEQRAITALPSADAGAPASGGLGMSVLLITTALLLTLTIRRGRPAWVGALPWSATPSAPEPPPPRTVPSS